MSAYALRSGSWRCAEVVSFTVRANQRSRALMERLGLQHDAAGDFEHPQLPPGDPLRRHVLYRLSRQRWQQSPPR